MLHAIIMAGGSGTRLWPESRKNWPKQLLTLGAKRSLLQRTVDRLGPCVRLENIHIVTGENLAEAVRAQVPELGSDGVLVEPCARNTAACIGLAAVLCLKNDPDATLVVLPSDHVINPTTTFCDTIHYAVQIVEENPRKLVTLGIPPTYPAESFGYIELGNFYQNEFLGIFHVQRFREKPDRQTAESFLKTDNFLWNSGIFVWKAATILENLRKYAPGVATTLETLRNTPGEWNSADFQTVLQSEFPKIENISVDYAVLEPAASAGDVVCVQACFSWNDIGSWRAMERIFTSDDHGNTILAENENVHLLDTNDCIIRSSNPQQLVTCFGVKDLAIIVTDDVVLIFDKNREESVREVTRKLKELNYEELL